MATHLLEGMLPDLAEARMTAKPYPAWLPELLQTLDHQLTTSIDYPQLADDFSLTELTLRRQFKAHLGVPIHTYVLRKKMALAGDLLRNSTGSVAGLQILPGPVTIGRVKEYR